MSRVVAVALAFLMLAQALVAGGLVVACTTANGQVELEWALAACCDQDDACDQDDVAIRPCESDSDSVHQSGCSCRDELLSAPDAKPAQSNSATTICLPAVSSFVELTLHDDSCGRAEIRPESSGPPQPRRLILVLRC